MSTDNNGADFEDQDCIFDGTGFRKIARGISQHCRGWDQVPHISHHKQIPGIRGDEQIRDDSTVGTADEQCVRRLTIG